MIMGQMRRLLVVTLLICWLLVSPGCDILFSPTQPEPSAPESAETQPPTSTVQSLEMIREIPQVTEQITRHYSWMYGDREWTWQLNVPRSLHDYYQELPRPPTRNYSVYVTHPWDDDYVKLLVDNIEKIARQRQFSDLEKIEFATAFVQHLPYTVDSVTTPYDEYPRYPVETLVSNGGDCEDTSILLASLLYSMGYGIILVIFPQTAATEGHCGIGVLGNQDMHGFYLSHDGGKYFYVETSSTGWRVGQLPDEYKETPAELYGMTPAPILAHSWTGTIKGNAVNLEVTVENLGSATADDVYILVGFDASEGKIWNPEESRRFELLVNQKITVSFILRAPFAKHTRLIIQIIDNNSAVDESYSEWFDT